MFEVVDKAWNKQQMMENLNKIKQETQQWERVENLVNQNSISTIIQNNNMHYHEQVNSSKSNMV
jgi:hypothetical protein